MTKIRIPKNVTSIGACVFRHCDKLTKIEVDEKNSVYDSRESCNAIIETDTDILVAGCIDTKIPEGVTRIEECAFDGCDNMTIYR